MILDEKLKEQYDKIMKRKVTPRNLDKLLEAIDLIANNVEDPALKEMVQFSGESLVLRLDFS